jgi:hypothetical protein
MKTKITELAKDLGLDVDKLLELKDSKLMEGDWSGKGKNTWFTEDAVRKSFLPLSCRRFCQTYYTGHIYTKLLIRDGFTQRLKGWMESGQFLFRQNFVIS